MLEQLLEQLLLLLSFILEIKIEWKSWKHSIILERNKIDPVHESFFFYKISEH